MKGIGSFVVCVYFFCCSAAVAQTSQSQAKMKFDEGVHLYSEGMYIEAAAAFLAAYQMKPTWKLYYNIAQAYTAAKKYGLALDYFENYLAEGGDEIERERVQETMNEVKRLQLMVGVLSVDAPDGVELFIDGISRGKTPFSGNLRVSVGDHRISLERDGEKLLDKTVRISGSMTTEVSAFNDSTVEADGDSDDGRQLLEDRSRDELDGPSNSKSKRLMIAGISSTAIGVAVIGLGVGFSIKGYNDSNTLDEAKKDYYASNRTSSEAYNRAKAADGDLTTDRVVTIVGYAAGGVLAATGIALLVLSKKTNRNKVGWGHIVGGVRYVF